MKEMKLVELKTGSSTLCLIFCEREAEFLICTTLGFINYHVI